MPSPTLVAACLLVAVLFYLYLAASLYWGVKLPLPGDRFAVPSAEELDGERWRPVRERALELPSRFVPMQPPHVLLSGAPAGLFFDTETGDVAAVARVRGVNVEYVTELVDGGSVQTSDTDEVGGFYAPKPGQRVFQFPGIRDPRRLYDAHRALVASLAEDRVARAESAEAAMAACVRDSRTTVERQVRAGYLRIHRGEVRLTFRGAVRAVAIIAPPGRWIRKVWKRGRDAAALRRARRVVA